MAYEKKYKTDEERKAARQEQYKKQQESGQLIGKGRAKKPGDASPLKDAQPGDHAPDDIKKKEAPPTPPETPATGHDAPVVHLDVPDINQINPWVSEPIVHPHANLGSAKTPADDVADTGNAIDDDKANQPPKQPQAPPQPGISADGTSKAPLGEGELPPITDSQGNPIEPGQQPGGMPVTKTQAEQTFEIAVGAFNHLVGTIAPKFIRIKLPEDVKHLPVEENYRIANFVETTSQDGAQKLKLNQDEINMLHDPAVTCLQESGAVISPQMQLMMACGVILINKGSIVAQMVQQNKAIAAQLKDDIAAMIMKNNGFIDSRINDMTAKVEALERELNSYKNKAA